MRTQERRDILDYYPDLLTSYPDLFKGIVDFIAKNQGITINLSSTPEEVSQAVNQLTDLTSCFIDVLKANRQDPVGLFRSYLVPSVFDRQRRARTDPDSHGYIEPGSEARVGMLRFGNPPEAHLYHMLWRERLSELNAINTLLVLSQRVPFDVDTGAEVHGIERTESEVLVPSQTGGIEAQIPLVDGVEYRVNNLIYKVDALAGFVVILPGDIHSVVRVSDRSGQRLPLRAVIIGGSGFGRGTNVEGDDCVDVSGFGQLPSGNYNSIARYYPAR